MTAITDLEFRILDELYFVSSYQNIIENVEADPSLVLEALLRLLQAGLVSQIKLIEGTEEKLDTPDLSLLEQSFFVASKNGLLIHNTRS